MASKCLVVNGGCGENGDNDKEFRHNVGGGLQVYDSNSAKFKGHLQS